MCLTGPVVASWSLMQEMVGLSPFAVMTNISVTEFTKFSENIQGKLKQMLLFNLHIASSYIITPWF